MSTVRWFLGSIAVLMMLAAVTSAAAESAANPLPEPRLTVPQGAYSLCRIPLKDAALIVGLREGKVVLVHAYSKDGSVHEFDPSQLAFDGKTLKGTAAGTSYGATATPGKGLTVEVNATVEGGKLTGATPGEYRTAEQMAKENALAAGPGWPWWYGPNGDFSGQDGGRALVENFSDARLVWVSEAKLRHGNVSKPTGYGGFTSCVEGDGKVFFNQIRACGPTKASNGCDAPPEKIGGETYLSIEADDEVWCMDAASGRTLWSVSFPNAAVNGPKKDKHTMYNLSGCYYAGKVFMLGFTYRLYALDANTGKLVWQGNIGEAHAEAEKQKRGMIASKTLDNVFEKRGSNAFLAVAGGVLFVNNQYGGVNGYDSETGQLRWTASGAYPHRWVNESKEFILVLNGGALECLDPKTGKPVWRQAGVGSGYCNALALSGDCLLLQAGGVRSGWATQFWKLSAAGATKAGENSQYGGIGGYLAAGHKGTFMVKWDWVDGKQCWTLCGPKTPNPWTLIEGSTGKVLAVGTFGNGGGWNTVSFFLEGRPFYCLDAGHACMHPTALDADFKPVAQWFPPTGGGYDVAITHPYVDGRWFIRGHYRIYCYDLRR